jgi:hypothetical protein
MFDWHWLLYDIWDAWDDFDLSINWGNVATVTVGALAAIGVIVTWQQKTRADKRSEWWRRTAWAFERTFSGSDVQVDLGWDMLDKLVGSTLATNDDVGIVLVISEHAALRVLEEEVGNGNGGNPQQGGAKPEPD